MALYQEPECALPGFLQEDLAVQHAIRTLPSLAQVRHKCDTLKYPIRRAKSTPPTLDASGLFDPSMYGSRLAVDSTGSRRPVERFPATGEPTPEREATPSEPTRIPAAFWKSEPTVGGILGSSSGGDKMVVWSEEHQAFRTIVFPSAQPASRREVLELTRVFESLFSDTQAAASRVEQAVCRADVGEVLEVLAPQAKAIDAVLHEACRQVSTQCAERGSLLSQVQQQQERLMAEMVFCIQTLGSKLDRLQRRQRSPQPEPEPEPEDGGAMQARLMSMIDSLLAERDTLTDRLGQLEAQLISTEAQVEKLVKERAASGPEVGSSTFVTEGRWEPAAASEREEALQARVEQLESEMRTMQKVVEVQAETEQAMTGQRKELRRIDDTAKELVVYLDSLKDAKAVPQSY